MRANANANGRYVNPLTGEITSAQGPLAAYHIVPQQWIKKAPGYDTLTPAQQSALLNDPINTQGLPKTFNSSKGAKMPGDWQTYNGQPLAPEYVANDALRSSTLQKYILEKITDLAGK